MLPSTPQVPSTADLHQLSKLIEELSNELDLTRLFDAVLRRACEIVGADDGAIGIYDRSKKVIRTTAVYRMPQREIGAEMAAGQGLTGRVLATGRIVQARYGDLSRDHLPERAEHQVLGVPILWRQVLLGVIGVGAAPPKNFDADAIQWMQLFAHHAATAIHNAERYQLERRRAQRYELISKIAAMVQSNRHIESILQNAADAIHELMGFENVDIPLIDPADSNFLLVQFRGGSYKRKITGIDRIPIASGIMGAAVRERKTQLVNDVRIDPRYVNPPGVSHAKAELAIPLCMGKQVLGVLNLEGDAPFTHFDQQSMELLANHLALALANAQLQSQAHRHAVLAERHRIASDLHDNVTQLVASMSLLSQSLAQSLRRDPVQAEQRAQRLHVLAQTTYAELRQMLNELSPVEQDQHRVSARSQVLLGIEQLRVEGLAVALQRHLASVLPESITPRLDCGQYQAQRSDHEESLFRVCQEAIANVIRHSGATELCIRAHVSERLAIIVIEDNGSGVANWRHQGLGLASMKKRLQDFGGALRITKRPPHGTRLEAALPRKDMPSKDFAPL
jgi:signal transduction histidine kinase